MAFFSHSTIKNRCELSAMWLLGEICLTPEVGLRRNELDDIAPAFEHAQLDEAISLLV